MTKSALTLPLSPQARQGELAFPSFRIRKQMRMGEEDPGNIAAENSSVPFSPRGEGTG